MLILGGRDAGRSVGTYLVASIIPFCGCHTYIYIYMYAHIHIQSRKIPYPKPCSNISGRTHDGMLDQCL